ncbi:hypothetical protein [Burkholderia sp. 22PA0106]|uniref:hypothetical protein n=1 Tax=Burkholderia sp. 22PA0106 TaxID=3237371 RepID=UPI0039C4D0DE
MPLNSLNNSSRIDRTSTPTTSPGNGHAGAPTPAPTGAASQQASGSVTLQRLGAVRRPQRAKTSGAGQAKAGSEGREEASSSGDHAQLSMPANMAALLAGSEGKAGAEDKTTATPTPPRQEAESKPDSQDSAPAMQQRPESAAATASASPTASQSAAPAVPPRPPSASSRPPGTPPPLPARPRPSGTPPPIPNATRPQGAPPPIPNATRPQGAPPPIPHATRPQGAPPPIPNATRPQGAPPPIPHATRPQSAPPPIPHATRPQGTPPPIPHATRPQGAPPAAAQPRPDNDLAALLQEDLATADAAPPAYTALPQDPVQNAHLWAGQLNVMSNYAPDPAAHIDDLLQLMGSRPISEANAGHVSLPDLPPAQRAAVAEQAVQTLCKTIASMPPNTLKARDVHGAIAAAQHVTPLAQRAVLLGDLAKMLNKVDSRGAHQSAFRAISDQVHLLPPQDRMQVLNGLALNAFHPEFADSPGAGQDAAANMRAVMNHLAHVPPDMRTPHETAIVLDTMAGWMPDMMANTPPSHWQPLVHELMQEAGKLPPEEGAFITDTVGKALDMMKPGGPLQGVDMQALLLVVPDHLKPGHRDED